MLIQQSGANRHEHICELFEVFAERVMPEFKACHTEKRRELPPFIQAALARKPRLAPVADADVPRVEAFWRKAASPILSSDCGGVMSIPTQDPLAARGFGR